MDALKDEKEELSQRNYQVNLSYLGRGQLFGEEDLIQNVSYTNTLICSQLHSAYY